MVSSDEKRVRMSRVRILYLIEDLGRGGAERRLLSDLRKIDKSSFEPIVCHLFPRKDLQEDIVSLGIPVFWLGLNRFSDLPKGILSLRQVIKKNRIALIHTQLFGADVVGRIAGRLLRIPVVSTIQSSVYEPGIPYFRSPRRQWLDGWTGRLCNKKFIAVSEFVKKSVVQRLKFREEKIVVIYNAVDVEEFSALPDRLSLRRQFGFRETETLLICVGKMNPPKGHRYLIEALLKVVPLFPHLKLLILGDGPSRKALETLGQSLGLKDHLVFLGEWAEVKEFLSLSDIFVFPTLSEGMPLALLEAMAVGKPCIASDIPPIREAIQDRETGLLVKPRSAEAIAEAILELLKSPEKAQTIALRGRESIFKRFDAEKSARLLETLYQEILNGKIGTP